MDSASRRENPRSLPIFHEPQHDAGSGLGGGGQEGGIIRESLLVIACEMEGAAIGQVCYVNSVPYGILRAISDGGDEQAFADYPTFLAAAAETATRVMLRFVENWQ